MRILKGFSLFLLFILLACNAIETGEQVTQLHKIKIDSPAKTKEFFTWTENAIPLISAHRGGPMPGYPENVIRHTYAIIETDISLTKDSVLVMMHDNTLNRTTTGAGVLGNYTYSELQKLYLVDKNGNKTSFKIPTLKEVLNWGRGKVIYTLDVKKGVPFEKVIKEVVENKAEAYSVIITYSLRDALKVYGLNPNLMISVSIKQPQDLDRALAAGLPAENIIAFVGVSQPDPSLYKTLHEKGIYAILGVLGNLDRKAQVRGDQLYREFIQQGADILATDRPLEAGKAIAPLQTISVERSEFYELD